MILPATVQDLIFRLNKAGFSAYAVGGCVRDTLLGREPHDWDLCTAASPEQMKQVFSGEHLIETGFRHGTLTVMRNHQPYEITTYRADGPYTDHRRPDSVLFVEKVQEDLARRDFTINAMACGPDGTVVDCFGGRQDLQQGIIRCVGTPAARFQEDALRILRALRFASVYDFTVEEDTADAARSLAHTLSMVSAERIRDELMKLLTGTGAGRILRQFPDVLCAVLPDLKPMIGFDQNNHHHHYDLWEHTVRAVEEMPAEADLRLVMLLHDTGKPYTCTTDSRGESHYYGHPDVSARITERVTAGLKCDRMTQDRVCRLVKYHEIHLRSENGAPDLSRSFLLRLLNQFGEEDLRTLFRMHRADRIATGYSSTDRENERLRERMSALDALLAEKPCFSIKDLAVNGSDLLALGLQGKAIGLTLQRLLEEVMAGSTENNREALLERVSSEMDKVRSI